jgi:hypothetical protein
MGFSPFRPTGVTYHDPTRAFAGYTLYTLLGGDLTLLIDMAGRVVHVWRPPAPLRPYYGYLLPGGHLLLRCTTGQEPWAPGGESGAVLELDSTTAGSATATPCCCTGSRCPRRCGSRCRAASRAPNWRAR